MTGNATGTWGRLVPGVLIGVSGFGGVAIATPGSAQEAAPIGFHVTADAAASLRDGPDGVRLGRDMVVFGVRLTATHRGGYHPWVDGARFSRPDLECLPGRRCNDIGWLARAGVQLPLSSDERAAGVHAAARAGLGAAFSDDTSLSYLLGFLVNWRAAPRIAPLFEVRWEHIGNINHMLLAAGLRVDL